MAFVNEYISPEDRVRHRLAESEQRVPIIFRNGHGQLTKIESTTSEREVCPLKTPLGADSSASPPPAALS